LAAVFWAASDFFEEVVVVTEEEVLPNTEIQDFTNNRTTTLQKGGRTFYNLIKFSFLLNNKHPSRVRY
jgi:hypothetical protein